MIELNNFYIGESVIFMRNNMPNNFVDLTITSPPYDDLRKYNGFIFDYQSMLMELHRITKDGGVVVWVVGDKTIKGSETGTSFKHALFAKEVGFNLHDTMIYAKDDPPPINSPRYNSCFEYMFVFTKGRIKTFNPIKEPCKKAGVFNGGTWRQEDGSIKQQTGHKDAVKDFKPLKNIWTYNVGYMKNTKDKIAYNHPANYPEKMVEDHIISWSNEGDIILDPMCGSGTTCKMAYINKRNFIGIDMSEKYINDICIPRLNTYGWQQNQKITFQKCL